MESTRKRPGRDLERKAAVFLRPFTAILWRRDRPASAVAAHGNPSGLRELCGQPGHTARTLAQEGFSKAQTTLGLWSFHSTGHCQAAPHLRLQEALETRAQVSQCVRAHKPERHRRASAAEGPPVLPFEVAHGDSRLPTGLKLKATEVTLTPSIIP